MYMQDSTIPHQDHVCRKGFTDSRSYYAHIVSYSSANSHLDQMFGNFDPFSFNIRYRSSHSTDHSQQRLVAHCKDILRSAVSYSAPEATYDVSLLDLARLTTNDLIILWENKLRSIQRTVQYPEVCVGNVSGSIYSRRVLRTAACLTSSYSSLYHRSIDLWPR